MNILCHPSTSLSAMLLASTTNPLSTTMTITEQGIIVLVAAVEAKIDIQLQQCLKTITTATTLTSLCLASATF